MFKISSDYPGGNIKLISIEDSNVKLEQELRDSTSWWFYWNFCVEDAEGLTITFEFMNKEVLGPWGPAVSKDRINWKWAGSDCLISRSIFKYTFDSNEKVYFAFSMPYQVSDFERFYSQYENHPLLKRDILTKSEQGRDVAILTIGRENAFNDIVFTSRHHACESTGAYVLEGVLRYFLNHSPKLLDTCRIHAIPFIDIDGVENGDQGKNRAPHDHNRDYINIPIYKSTSALMRYVEKLNPVIGIDYHAPYKWGGNHDYLYIVKRSSPIKERIEEFGEILKDFINEDTSPDKIIFDEAYSIEMGESWNKEGTPTFATFMENRGAHLCFTLEVPYFGIGNTVYTQKNLRSLGTNFAKAIEKYYNLHF